MRLRSAMYSARKFVLAKKGIRRGFNKKEFPITGFYTLLPINLQAASRGDYFVIIFDADGKKLATGKVHIK